MCVAGAGTLADEEKAMMNVVTWGGGKRVWVFTASC